MKNYWETYIKTDKMAGLFLWRSLLENYIFIKPWDIEDDVEIHWRLLNNKNEVWKWVICTKEDINWVFAPFFADWSIRPYSRRHGSLWRPKTKWIIRLQSNDWREVQLDYCNWWGEIQKNIVSTWLW